MTQIIAVRSLYTSHDAAKWRSESETIGVQLVLRFKLKERIADREFRERRRIPLQEVADATGLNRMTLSKLINHYGVNVQTDVLDKLCTYFGCRLDELVEYVDQPVDRGGVVGAVDD